MEDAPKKPGRQHLVTRTAGELVRLVGTNAAIAVSQASLRKLIGTAGLAKLLAEDEARKGK